MKILRVNIMEFGKFKDVSFEFGDRLNIIEGENESGKSTLLAFIKFIFYGISGRTSAGSISERDRYLSWGGETAGGSLTIETNDGQFRIERVTRHIMSGGRDSFPENVRIVDFATGEIVHNGEEPGDVFLGVPASVFESTCSVRQSRTQQLSGAELGASIENMLFTGDESINTQKAGERLEKSRKVLSYKNGKGGLLFDKTEEKRILEDRLSRARAGAAAIVDKQNKLDILRTQVADQKQQLAVAEQRCNNYENLTLLKRFDQLHEWEEKAARAQSSLDEWQRKCSAGGFVPDNSYLVSLRALSQQIRSAESDCKAAVSRRVRAYENLPAARDPLAERALTIRSEGGKQAICQRYASADRGASRLLRLGFALLLLGIILFGTGMGLLITDLLPDVAVYACSVAGLVIALAAGCVFVRRRQYEQYRLMIRNQYELPEGSAVSDLEARLALCLDHATQRESAENERLEADALLTERRRVLRVSCQECQEQLSRGGVDVLEDVSDDVLRQAEQILPVLESTIANLSDVITAHEATCRELDRCHGNVDHLRRELNGQNEAALRASLPEDLSDVSTEDDILQLRAEKEALRQSLTESETSKIEMEKQLVSLEATADDPVKLTLRIEELNRLLTEGQTRLDALTLAEQALTMASARIRRGVTPRLRSAAGTLMAHLTQNRYHDIGITNTMDMTLEVNGVTRPVEALSNGTADAAYLSLRLALLELLFGSERPPMMLDEALSQMDDRRAYQFLTMLTSWCNDGCQALLFTCHGREAAMQKEIGHFTHVRL